MKVHLTIFAAIAFVFFGCQKEKSFEGGGSLPTICKNAYAGGCKLTKIIYEPTNPQDTQQIVNITYTGNQITQAEDADDLRKIFYNADGKISKIEYQDKTAGLFLYAIKNITYNANKQVLQKLFLIRDGAGGFDSLLRVNNQYNNVNQLTKKTIFEYNDVRLIWEESEVYQYLYDTGGLANIVTYTDKSINPPTPLSIAVTYNDSCNNFQKIYPQIELIDYYGMEESGGFSLLFTSKKLMSSLSGGTVSFTLNQKNAPVEIRIGGKLLVSYIYICL